MRFCQPLTDNRLQNERLKNSDSVKYLRIHLDRELSFDVHVVAGCKTLVRACALLVARITNFVSRNVLILYYRSFNEQIVRYGLQIYGCTTSSYLYGAEKTAYVDLFQKAEKVYPAFSQNLLS